jgi:hypothetical protein
MTKNVCPIHIWIIFILNSVIVSLVQPNSTKLGMLIPWDQEENIDRSKLWKSVLSLSTNEGGSCSSETKHDRRMAPRPKLFVLARRSQEQRPQPQKSVLGSSHIGDGFCSSETKHNKRVVPRPKLFVLARRLQEQRPQPQKTVLGLSPGKDFGFRDNFCLIFSDTYQMIRCMDSFQAIKIDKEWKHLLNFPTVTLQALC